MSYSRSKISYLLQISYAPVLTRMLVGAHVGKIRPAKGQNCFADFGTLQFLVYQKSWCKVLNASCSAFINLFCEIIREYFRKVGFLMNNVSWFLLIMPRSCVLCVYFVWPLKNRDSSPLNIIRALACSRHKKLLSIS